MTPLWRVTVSLTFYVQTEYEEDAPERITNDRLTDSESWHNTIDVEVTRAERPILGTWENVLPLGYPAALTVGELLACEQEEQKP